MRNILFIFIISLVGQQLFAARDPLSQVQKRKAGISKRFDGITKRVLKTADFPWSEQQRQAYVDTILARYQIEIARATTHQALDVLGNWIGQIQDQLDNAYAEILQRKEDDEFQASLAPAPTVQTSGVSYPKDEELEHAQSLALVRLRVGQERGLFSAADKTHWETILNGEAATLITFEQFTVFYLLKKQLAPKYNELNNVIEWVTALGFMSTLRAEKLQTFLGDIRRELEELAITLNIRSAEKIKPRLATAEIDIIGALRCELRAFADEKLLSGAASCSSNTCTRSSVSDDIDKAKNLSELCAIVEQLQKQGLDIPMDDSEQT